MKYLKSYNESTKPVFRKYVEETCDDLFISNWNINDDGKVDVDGDVRISNCGLEEIPFKFGMVTGDFVCNCNNLKTLEGSPDYVGGYFSCNKNELVSLKGSPIRIGEYFSCGENKLKTLVGGPRLVNGDYYCDYNEIASLKGAPEFNTFSLDCSNNKLSNLVGIPIGLSFIDCSNNKLVSVDGIRKCNLIRINDNPITPIYVLFNNGDDYKSTSDFIESMDYSYIRGNNIVKTRFQEVCEEYRIKMPNNIKGYNWI
jgi:hypothetical protein